jgi:hypothetical protein
MEGVMNVPSGVQIAQLALKHRQNKNQRQRIVLFAGSPIDADKETLVKIGKKLKKNNVAVDIVNFGEEDPSKVRRQRKLTFIITSKGHVLDPSHSFMLRAFKSLWTIWAICGFYVNQKSAVHSPYERLQDLIAG